MKTLKLDEKQAKKLYKTASKEFKQILNDTFGEAFFSESIIDRIQDLDDIFSDLGLEEKDVLIFQKPKNKFEKYINACAIIPKIVEVYNEEWEPNWNSSSEYKYLPYFKKVGLGWSFFSCYTWGADYSAGPSGHHYKTLELGKDACTKFNEIYNDFYNG